MPETTPLIKAALNLRVGVGFDVYSVSTRFRENLDTDFVITISIRPFIQSSIILRNCSLFVVLVPVIPS